jgi:hypothetical protein
MSSAWTALVLNYFNGLSSSDAENEPNSFNLMLDINDETYWAAHQPKAKLSQWIVLL